ncbi:MAG: phosphatidate cytidylyltransferase [Clostridiales bacterium]|jgi:phosphatidate cytidylyltransferase|nr:phosphatidate cytidylyltransferase [Clostridiales bacterium]
MRSNLSLRVIFGFAALGFLIIAVILPSWGLNAAVILLSVLSAVEIFYAFGKQNVLYSIILSVIIFALFSCISFIRIEENGNFLIWAAFIGAFVTDTFAYIFGIFFGRHKLCEKISPKKTWEGAIGGGICTIIAFWIFGMILENNFLLKVNFVNLMILGVLCAIFSQLGDLTASFIKRRQNIKDFGNILPGHGGILDRCDSLLFTAPLVFIFVNLFRVIT